MADKLYSFTDENIAKAPAQAGVYILYKGRTVIYIGRSKGGNTTIRSRLADHKAGRDGACTQKATRYWRQVTPKPVSKEKELLELYRRQHGKLPECNERVG